MRAFVIMRKRGPLVAVEKLRQTPVWAKQAVETIAGDDESGQ